MLKGGLLFAIAFGYICSCGAFRFCSFQPMCRKSCASEAFFTKQRGTSVSLFTLRMISEPNMPTRFRDFRQGSLSSEKKSGRMSKMIMHELMGIVRSPNEIKSRERLPESMSSTLSIVDVDMSIDLKIAKVFVSCVGTESEKKEFVKWLTDHNKQIRYALAQRMRHLRTIPELRFAAADMKAAIGIMSLLERLREERETAEATDKSPIGAADASSEEEASDEDAV